MVDNITTITTESETTANNTSDFREEVVFHRCLENGSLLVPIFINATNHTISESGDVRGFIFSSATCWPNFAFDIKIFKPLIVIFHIGKGQFRIIVPKRKTSLGTYLPIFTYFFVCAFNNSNSYTERRYLNKCGLVYRPKKYVYGFAL